MEYCHPGPPSVKKFETLMSATKVMLTIFWDASSVLYTEFLTKGLMVNSDSTPNKKKRCSPDYKNHFLDTWEILKDPVVLAEKLDSYENVKPSSQKLTKLSNSRFSRNTGNPEFRKSHSFKVEKNVSGNHNSAFANPSYMPARNTNTGFHPPISCYGCGNPGFIKS
ncbi:transposon Tf2-8 polyprotein [Trichonephila clavipes]|nr:transposon Tf2-8 polyprotein [Trichonephila clavipes]